MQTGHPWADLARVVLNLGVGAGSLALSLVVVGTYVRAYLGHRRAVADGVERRAWRGLLPLHVLAVAAAHAVLIVATMAETYTHLRDPPTWRIAVYAVAYALSLWAMWTVLGHERHRSVDVSKRR